MEQSCRPRDHTTEMFCDRLMSETDSEERHLVSIRPIDDLHRIARACWIPWSWRDHHTIEGVKRCIVDLVVEDCRMSAELLQVADEIEDEGISVVDHCDV